MNFAALSFFILFCANAISEIHLLASPPGRQPQLRESFGKNARANQFPWHVSISFVDHNGEKHYCGGSIISNRWVLTAAHCVFSSHKQVTLGFGSIDLYSPAVVMTSSNFKVFPAYNPINFLYDIALVKLPRPLKFSDSIKPIALPTLAQEKSDFDNRPAFLSGFGKTTNGGNVSAHLHWTSLKIISNEICSKTFLTIIRPSILCTISLTKYDQGPCPGDSGGALVISESGKWFQVGVMSFIQDGSCVSGKPAAYMRLTFLHDWIREIIEN